MKRSVAVSQNDRDLQDLKNARQLVQWVYQAKLKNVSEPFDLNGKFVVATLASIKNKGIAPIEQVKSEVDLAVRKQMKEEKLKEKINQAKIGVSTVQDLALKLNTSVETANGLAFTSYSIGTAGIQPKVIAYATSYKKDKLSEPIDGTDGVYVLYITNIMDAQNVDDVHAINNMKRTLDMTLQNRIKPEGEPKSALIKLADIEDFRYKFP